VWSSWRDSEERWRHVTTGSSRQHTHNTRQRWWLSGVSGPEMLGHDKGRAVYMLKEFFVVFYVNQGKWLM